MESEAENEAVRAVRERIRGWLTEDYGAVEDIGGSGMVRVRYESFQAFVSVNPLGADGVIVGLIAWVLQGVPRSDALNEWVAYHGTEPLFCAYFLDPNEDSASADLCLGRNAPGDSLTASELRQYLAHMFGQLQQNAGDLQARFGGRADGG